MTTTVRRITYRSDRVRSITVKRLSGDLLGPHNHCAKACSVHTPSAHLIRTSILDLEDWLSGGDQGLVSCAFLEEYTFLVYGKLNEAGYLRQDGLGIFETNGETESRRVFGLLFEKRDRIGCCDWLWEAASVFIIIDI
jgi:hypothetical protein